VSFNPSICSLQIEEVVFTPKKKRKRDEVPAVTSAGAGAGPLGTVTVPVSTSMKSVPSEALANLNSLTTISIPQTSSSFHKTSPVKQGRLDSFLRPSVPKATSQPKDTSTSKIDSASPCPINVNMEQVEDASCVNATCLMDIVASE
jgi:hypothetical protein